MEHSKVYQCVHFLTTLRDATPSDRKTILQNLTALQLSSIIEVAKRLNNGTINPLRRDAQLFESRRLMLRTLTSRRVSVKRKKALMNSHSSIIPLMLKSVYLIQTVLDEIREP